MDIDSKQIKSKKRIGTLHGKPVLELACKGGFWAIAGEKDGKMQLLGTGAHRGLARFIAEKREKDIQLFELSKSDQLDVNSMESLAPKYEAITDLLNQKLSEV